VLAAAKAGKHISLQKPVFVELWEGRKMTEAARAAGVVLRITENFIFYPAYRLQKQMLDAGEIGEPRSIAIRLCGAAGGWWVPLKTWLWRLDFDECGGTPSVYDDGYHKLSIAKFMLGGIESVKAWIDFTFGAIDTPALVSWKHEAGPVGNWEVTTAPNLMSYGKYYGADEWVELTGTKGVLTATRCTSRLMEIPPLILYKNGRHTAIDDIRDDWSDSFHDAGHHFIDSLLAGTQPALTGEDALYLMKFWKAIWQSHCEGRAVRLEEVKEEAG